MASGAALWAVLADRFEDRLAGLAALTAGALPWLMVGMLSNWLPQVKSLEAAGLFGSGPLFLLAFFRYRFGPRDPRWQWAEGATVVGMLAALGFFMAWARAMSLGE